MLKQIYIFPSWYYFCHFLKNCEKGLGKVWGIGQREGTSAWKFGNCEL